ncbi:alginate O-acetyltransferase AlgX-related protein [Azorhizobium doebereinerae]|uniref:alginate O-acetyltransferase AlgX-related protein n=1 Tax=Azorhizobium doebereinerae TaxID=281091 RepID=UPI00048DFE24|nr:hypothetical protein [Azorhizobium doebereinerae]
MTDKHRLVATALFLATCTACVVPVVLHLSGPAGRSLAERLSWSAILDGRFAAAFDRDVAAGVPGSARLNGIIDGAVYGLVKDAGAQVRAGCPQWLFLAEETQEVRGGAANLAARARLARLVAADFARRDIALVALPVPDKVDLADAETCGLAVSGQARARLADWRAASRDVPLHQVDIVSGWPMPGFLRTDTHWDIAGAAFAARRAAAVAAALVGAGETHVTRSEGAPYERPGDLMRLADLTFTAAVFGPRPDVVRDVSVDITRSGGLLDEAPAPGLVLAGSSFSLNSGFLEALEAALAREVVQRSEAGGGFAGALLALLEKDAGALKPVTLVIWEWPVRSLTLPLTPAERRYMEIHAHD